LENKFTHFAKRCAGSVGSNTAIFDVRTVIGQGDRSRMFRMKFNHNHFLAVIAPELSKENSSSKRRIDDKEQIVRMNSSMDA
jgi:hypothetical protein